jgi:hypothetical protein
MVHTHDAMNKGEVAFSNFYLKQYESEFLLVGVFPVRVNTS